MSWGGEIVSKIHADNSQSIGNTQLVKLNRLAVCAVRYLSTALFEGV